MVKQGIKRVTVVMLAMLMVLALAPTNAFAATRKTVKTMAFTTEKAAILKKDTVVKRGTTYLTYAKKQGYLSFVAPSTKTYTFTFSNLKCKGGNNAYVSILEQSKYSKQYVTHKQVSTYGGKSSTLWLSINGYKFSHSSKVDRPIASRTAKMKLKKGQRIFLYAYYGINAKMTAKLVIK